MIISKVTTKFFFTNSSDSSMLKVVNTDGASMPHFRLSHKMLEMDERQGINNMICSVLDNLWNSEINFKDGASMKYWFKSSTCLPILSLKYETNFVCYGMHPNKATNYFTFHNEKVVNFQILDQWTKPTNNAICIIHNGQDHFDYL